MNLDETGELLKLATAYDNRTVGDADLLAWGLALEKVPHSDATRAMVEHYTRTPDRRATPGDIWAIHRRYVRERFARTPTPIPPRELADDPPAELAWRRARDAEIAADTYVPPPAPVLVRRDVRAIAGVFRSPGDVAPVPGEDAPEVAA